MSRTLPVVILALVACGEPEEEGPGLTQQTGTTTEAVCNILTETTLAMTDEGGDLGFSPEDLLLQVESTWGDLVEWPVAYMGEGLDVTLTYDGGAMTYYEREIQGVPDLELSDSCRTVVEVEILMTMVSSEYTLDETFNTTLVAELRDLAKFEATLAPGDINGTWTPEFSEIDSTAYSSWELHIEGQATDEGTSGTLSVIGTGTDGSEMSEEAGTWKAPESPS